MKNTNNASNEKRLLNVNELADYLGLGRCTADTLATKINARINIGRRVLYDKNIVDEYLDKHSKA